MRPVPFRSPPLPRARRAGPFSRPHRREQALRWRWRGAAFPSPLLVPGDPFDDEAARLARRTPTGLTETELLAAFNYLDRDALLAFDGIGATLAGNILARREETRYFATLDELADVPRIGARRFAKLAGRPPETTRFRLHDLMRRPRRDDLRLADLQPWAQPAPGLLAVHLVDHHSPAPIPAPGQTLTTARLRRHHIHFIAQSTQIGGRVAFLQRVLPDVLRPLLA